MIRDNADGMRRRLTLPSQRVIKGSTLRTIQTQAGSTGTMFSMPATDKCPQRCFCLAGTHRAAVRIRHMLNVTTA
jgi:hypothetical protein